MKFASKKQQERYEKGLCVYCDNVRVNAMFCQVCRDKINNARKLNVQKRIKNGKCINCENPLVTARHCQVHQERHNKFSAKYNQKSEIKTRIANNRRSEQGKAANKIYQYNYSRSEQGKKTRRNYKKRVHFIKNENVWGNLQLFIPKDLPQELREDVCQEILLRLCSNQLNVDEIKIAVKDVIKQQRKFLPSKYQVQIDSLEDWQRDRLEQRFNQSH